jgi:hypothetical protein
MINQAIHGALEKITLAEMTQPLRHQLVNLSEPGTRAETGTATNFTVGTYE